MSRSVIAARSAPSWLVEHSYEEEVVGVLKARSPASSSGGDVERFDGDVYIPLRAWRERVGQLVVATTGPGRGGGEPRSAPDLCRSRP